MSLLDDAIHCAHQEGLNVEITFREWTSHESTCTYRKGIFYKVISPKESFGRGIAREGPIEYSALFDRIAKSICETVELMKNRIHVSA